MHRSCPLPVLVSHRFIEQYCHVSAELQHHGLKWIQRQLDCDLIVDARTCLIVVPLMTFVDTSAHVRCWAQVHAGVQQFIDRFRQLQYKFTTILVIIDLRTDSTNHDELTGLVVIQTRLFGRRTARPCTSHSISMKSCVHVCDIVLTTVVSVCLLIPLINKSNNR